MRWLVVLCGLVSVVLWTLFVKVSRMTDLCPPLLTGLRDGLGVLFFAIAALASLLISAAMVLSARKSGSWGDEGNSVFWGAVFLAVVFLVSALQFLVLGQWHAVRPGAYLVIKWALLIGVLVYLIRALVYYRRFRR